MQSNSQIFYSNHLEQLVQRLTGSLYALGSLPLTSRFIIVPSLMMKEWLQKRIADEVGIATGFQFLFLHQAINSLANISSERLPTLDELIIRLERLLQEKATQFDAFSSQQQQLWMPVMRFLKKDSVKQISRKRLQRLAEEVAHLFLEYGLYAGEMVSAWEKSAPQWQAVLWNELFNDEGSWSYPHRELSQAHLPEKKEMQVHLFCFSYIPPLYQRFLRRASANFSLYTYALSPCQALWSDIRSDKEMHRLHAFWKARGAPEKDLELLEHYLRDRNPLLANFGRLGREFVSLLEQGEESSEENYIVPQKIASQAVYESLFDASLTEFTEDTSENPVTMLEMIQADMLLMRDGTQSEPLEISPDDRSIQIHAVPTLLREVQVLHRLLLQQVSHTPLEEILVMAPDIAEYVPYIQAVFGGEENPIPFQLYDVKKPAQGSLVDGFLLLLSLMESRWSVSTILQLLEHPAFCARHRLCLEETHQLREWIKQTGIRWGLDGEHRQKILSDRYQHQQMKASTAFPWHVFSWEHGFHHLLNALAMQIDPKDILEDEENVEHIATTHISLSSAELLGKIILLCRSLWEDLKTISECPVLSLAEWADVLQSLFEAYLQPSESNLNDRAQKEMLLDQFQAMRRSSIRLQHEKMAFSSAHNALQRALQEHEIVFNKNQLSSIKFCSLLPMRAIPAQIICLIGMHEGAFPRQDKHRALNLMKSYPSSNVDYVPSRVDYDRYLFLETLISARKQLVMTYQSVARQDAQAQSPSLLGAELLSYLDNSCTIEGKKPSACIVKHHHLAPFHSSELSDPAFPHFSLQNLQLAVAHGHCDKGLSENNFLTGPKVELSSFLRRREIVATEVMTGCVTINVRDLMMTARNPLETYFRKTLGIFLGDDRRQFVDEHDPLKMLPKEISLLAKRALKQPLELVVAMAEKQGLLPADPLLRKLARQEIEKKRDELQQRLEGAELEAHELCDIQLTEACQQSTWLAKSSARGHWMLPSLEITVSESLQVKIVGTVKDISAKGLLLYKEGTPKNVMEALPSALVFFALKMLPEPHWQQQLLVEKKKSMTVLRVESAEEHLRAFLRYHFLCLKNPSMLLPEWLPAILSGDVSKLQKEMQKSLVDDREHFYNAYAKWVYTEQTFPCAKETLRLWQPVAEETFRSVWEQLFPEHSLTEVEA